MKNSEFKILKSALVVLLSSNMVFAGPSILLAQTANNLPPPPATTNTLKTTSNDPELNPNSSAFKIVVCDGPTLPASVKAKLPNGGADYVPCDFNGVMRQVQHLINIMVVLGVLVAIVMFSYAGLLYISGQKAKIDKAHTIFPKIIWGFIIMLSAWFIVYQILSWLTNNAAFSTLLGSPQ